MGLDRRELFTALAGLGLGTAAFQKALAAEIALADEPKKESEPAPDVIKVVTPEMVQNAEWLAGITLTEVDRKSVATTLTGKLAAFKAVRKTPLPNALAPALQFNPVLGLAPAKTGPGQVARPRLDIRKPDNETDLAFLSVAQLGALLRSKLITSVELTKLCLSRLRKYDPKLLCVVTLTEDVAMKQAEAADALFKAGKDLGPLQGIPWGAKDLIAYPGYPTTWGAEHFKTQTFTGKATVAGKLEAAGAVLVAKLTLGALALGDVWFGGKTRNPWNPEDGSSGSSAGSCSAVSAGLVPFAIGSETLGSIVSPSTRCGVTGLRPTFGRVSRAGCMALCWTMDKIGPIARSVEDTALIFDAIMGRDAADPTTVSRDDYGFDWPKADKLAGLTVGYVEGRTKAEDRAELKVLKELGATLKPISLPYPIAGQIVGTILEVECATAFDELPRAGVRDGYGKEWRTTFQAGQFVTAVEYLRANRLRTTLMEKMAEVMKDVDLYVGGSDLTITNLTGHPSVCLPNGFVKQGDRETPRALTFTGRLYGESVLLHAAHHYQLATGHHLKHPKLD